MLDDLIISGNFTVPVNEKLDQTLGKKKKIETVAGRHEQ